MVSSSLSSWRNADDADVRPGARQSSPNAAGAGPARVQSGPKIAADLEEDAYRDRMRVNFFAAGLLIVLMGLGMCIANAMVDTQKAHGCYASGQRFCALI
jgi:hypothetical protein